MGQWALANETARIEQRWVEAVPSVPAVIAAVAGWRDPVVLDCVADDPAEGACRSPAAGSPTSGWPTGRYTVIAFDPVEVASWREGEGDPFQGVRQRLCCSRGMRAGSTESERGLQRGFRGGWIGYFAYEAGRWIERLPATTARDIDLPIARFGLYTVAAIHDAVTGRWSIESIRLPEFCGRGGLACSVDERVAEWLDILRAAQPPAELPHPSPAHPTTNMSREEYLDLVRRAREYITAGDIFQVNLARRLTYPAREPALATYLRLRRENPAAYAAFLSWREGERRREGETERRGEGETGRAGERELAILSASPELFLELRDGHVVTRPIKGTRARSADPVVDAARRMELLHSAKDRAELAMIVDLERNDLGRVCEFGTVRVVPPVANGTGVLLPADSCLGMADPAAPRRKTPVPFPHFDLETHPTVHHLVATVCGRLRPGLDAVDLLRATFPGGSITGAPKVRAMEIIDELEPTERSVYTGAIGCFGLDGSAIFNIAIRTMIHADGKIHIPAGGGIVADSVPEDEYEETEAKALGLCRALGAERGVASVPQL